MIPKIIHQTWKTSDIPDQWKEATKSCKQYNKDYKYILWTHAKMDQFVKKNFPEFYNTYKSYTYHIQRCDAFRFLVLNKYGGIYMDLDIECKKSLNKLLNYDVVLANSANVKTIFTNGFFMSVPKHPFLKYCIDHLKENKDNYSLLGKHFHVMYSTGPLFLTDMVNRFGKIKNIHILSNKEFSGDCTICNENECKGGTYFKHIMGNSWHNFDSTLYNFLYCNHKKIIGGLFICSGLYLLS